MEEYPQGQLSNYASRVLTAVGFEPTPLRTGTLSQRLRPLGQTVLEVFENVTFNRKSNFDLACWIVGAWESNTKEAWQYDLASITFLVVSMGQGLSRPFNLQSQMQPKRDCGRSVANANF